MHEIVPLLYLHNSFLFFVITFCVGTGQITGFRFLFHQKCPALRTFLVDRFIPIGLTAFRIAAASVKQFAPFAFSGYDIFAALRAGNPRRLYNRLGVLTLRISGAGDKFTETPCLQHHGLAAELTGLSRRPVSYTHLTHGKTPAGRPARTLVMP